MHTAASAVPYLSICDTTFIWLSTESLLEPQQGRVFWFVFHTALVLMRNLKTDFEI